MNIRGVYINKESIELKYDILLLSIVSFIGTVLITLYLLNNLNNIIDNGVKIVDFIENKYNIVKRNIWLKYMKTLGKSIEKEKKSPRLNPRKLSETFELLDIADNSKRETNKNEVQYEPIIIKGKNNTCIKLYAIIEEV